MRIRDLTRQDVPIIIALLAQDEHVSQREALGEPQRRSVWRYVASPATLISPAAGLTRELGEGPQRLLP